MKTNDNQEQTTGVTVADVGSTALLGSGSFHRWRIRKELPDGFFTFCDYNATLPVTAESVSQAPSVLRWLGSDRLDAIYHPDA